MDKINDMYHVCTRKTMEEINVIVDRLNNAVQASGYITRATLFSNCLGEIPLMDEYYHVGWTIGACEQMVLRSCKNGYNLYLPQPDWFDSEYKKEKTKFHYAKAPENRMEIVTFLSNYDEVIKVLHCAEQIIKVYGYVSLADMLDLCGKNATYMDSKIGWTGDAFKNAKIRVFYEGCTISMPEYDWFGNTNYKKEKNEMSGNNCIFGMALGVRKCQTDANKSSDEQTDEYPQPEPINITIPVDKLEAIKETINTLCDNIDRIKDRPIFISIM